MPRSRRSIEAIDLICSGFAGADELAEAISRWRGRRDPAGGDRPRTQLSSAAAEVSKVPAISLQSGFAEPMNRARVAAALFAAGALGQPQPLFAGSPARPIDIWRDQVFITNPCQVAPQQLEAAPSEPTADLSAIPAEEPAVAAQQPVAPVAPPGAAVAPPVASVAPPVASVAPPAASVAPPAASVAPPVAPVAPPVAVPDEESAAVPAPERTAVPAGEAVADPAPEAAAVPASVPAPEPADPAVPAPEPADPAVPAQEPADSAVAAQEPADVAVEALSVHPLDRRAVPADDDGISSLRNEFERRLPARALIEAAAAVVTPAEPLQAAESAPDTPAPDTPAPSEPAPSDPSRAAPAAERLEPVAVRAEPARHTEPVAGRTARVAGPAEANLLRDLVAVPSAEQSAPVDGVKPWARCFAEELRPARPPVSPEVARAWRIHAATRSPMLADLSALFTADPTANRTLAIVGDPADERSRLTAVQAARDAVSTGELVVLTTSAGFTGFFASVYAEHPSIGITVLRMPEGARVPAVALQFAHADPAVFRELVIGPNGTVCEPVRTELALPGGGASLVDTDDVVLVSRDSGSAGLVLARVLALCGAGVAVIGRAGDNDDSELVAGLEQLRSAGARIGYEVIDITDPASLAAAVQRIEDRLGPVTAIGHRGDVDVPVPLQDLTDAQLGRYVTDHAGMLDRLVSSVKPGQLKLIVTFGSVAGRYGMAGASLTALADRALEERADWLAHAGAGCRAVHIDMPAFSTPGLGDRAGLADELGVAGVAPVELGVASRLLLKIMTTPDLPAASRCTAGSAASPLCPRRS